MGRRLKWTVEQKLPLVLSILRGEGSVAEIGRRHQVSDATLTKWRDAFLSGGAGQCQHCCKFSVRDVPGRSNEPVLSCVGNCFEARMHSQLAQNMLGVIAYRRRAYAKHARDARSSEARREKLKHLHLAPREARECGVRVDTAGRSWCLP